MANLSKENEIYQIPQNGRMPTRIAPECDDDGLPVVEKLTKLPYRVALNKIGNIVRVPMSNAPAIRAQNTEYGRNIAEWKVRAGFVWADECPVESGSLKRSQVEKLFGADVTPCRGRFDEYNHCEHLVDLQKRRRSTHETASRKVSENATSLEQLLKEDMLERRKAELDARQAAKAKAKK